MKASRIYTWILGIFLPILSFGLAAEYYFLSLPPLTRALLIITIFICLLGGGVNLYQAITWNKYHNK